MVNLSEGVMNLLFPTPILTFTLDNHTKNKEQYFSKIINYYKTNKTNKANWSRHDKTCTWFDHNIDFFDKQMRDRINFYLTYLAQEKPKYGYDFSSWFNLHTENDYMGEHEHHGSICSGIYYFQFNNETDKSAIFVNPARTSIDTWNIINDDNIGYKNKFLTHDTSNKNLYIKEGSVVLFPAYLKHYVPAAIKQNNNLRITYTFNVVLNTLEKRIKNSDNTNGYIKMNYLDQEPKIIS